MNTGCSNPATILVSWKDTLAVFYSGLMDGAKFQFCLSKKLSNWVIHGMPLLTVFASAPLHGCSTRIVPVTTWALVAVIITMEVTDATTRVTTRSKHGDIWRKSNKVCSKAYIINSGRTLQGGVTQPPNPELHEGWWCYGAYAASVSTIKRYGSTS